MRILTPTLLAVWSAAALAGTEHSVDAETGLAAWQTETGGIQVRLTQISPDQARAFYQARGVSAPAAERYAAECVFMTVVRNTGDTPIRHRLADWRYLRLHGGVSALEALRHLGMGEDRTGLKPVLSFKCKVLSGGSQSFS